MLIVESIADDDVVLLGLLTAHLRLRHADRLTLIDDPALTDVLRHFRVEARDAN